MRAALSLGFAVCLALGASIPLVVSEASADDPSRRSDVADFSQLKKGMKGYGLTVFEGEVPERFDVEVIDVLHNFRPKQDMLLIKTVHPRLDTTKIVAGMSGSPIYFDGKMVGAYAYGWSFGVEPVAGVTPITSMLQDLDRPIPPVLRGIPFTPKSNEGAPKRDSTLASVRAERTSRVASVEGRPDLIPVSTPLLVSGLTKGAIDELTELWEPLGVTPMAGGGSAVKPGAPVSKKSYVDGGAIGVDLVRGDMSAMGLGTVTRVEKDKLVAFGHPMMSVGVTSLPTSRARVLWFMASQQRSFKMGEGIEPLGALVNDRMSSIVVDEKAVAPTVGVHLKVVGEPGAPKTDWNFQIAHDEFLSPSFLAVAIGSGIEAAAQERRDVTWTMESTLKLQGQPPIRLRDFGSSPSGTPQTGEIAQSSLIAALSAVFGNPWEYVRVESVDVTLSLSFAREVSRIRGAELLTPVVNVGDTAKVRVWLSPFVGPMESIVLGIKVPPEAAGKTFRFTIEPGYSVRRPRPAAENLSQLVANLSDSLYEPRSLVLSYPKSDGAGAFSGVIAEGLPPGALDRLVTTSTTIGPQQYQVHERVVHKTRNFIVGTESVEVQVRSVAH